MSVKELKAIILAAGSTVHDCVEKADLIARAAQVTAVPAAAETAGTGTTAAGTATATATAANSVSLRHILRCVYKQPAMPLLTSMLA